MNITIELVSWSMQQIYQKHSSHFNTYEYFTLLLSILLRYIFVTWILDMFLINNLCAPPLCTQRAICSETQNMSNILLYKLIRPKVHDKIIRNARAYSI